MVLQLFLGLLLLLLSLCSFRFVFFNFLFNSFFSNHFFFNNWSRCFCNFRFSSSSLCFFYFCILNIFAFFCNFSSTIFINFGFCGKLVFLACSGRFFKAFAFCINFVVFFFKPGLVFSFSLSFTKSTFFHTF